MVTNLKEKYTHVCQKVGAAFSAPKQSHVQVALFGLGVALLTAGLLDEVIAQGQNQGARTINYNDQRITESTNAVLTYLEGSFGALVMVASGIGAILSAAFGQYRAALGLMVVAIGSFILRSLMSTFFNDSNIQG